MCNSGFSEVQMSFLSLALQKILSCTCIKKNNFKLIEKEVGSVATRGRSWEVERRRGVTGWRWWIGTNFQLSNKKVLVMDNMMNIIDTTVCCIWSLLRDYILGVLIRWRKVFCLFLESYIYLRWWVFTKLTLVITLWRMWVKSLCCTP